MSEMRTRPCLAIDFDGTLTPDAEWPGTYGEVDFEGIHLAHQARYAVAIFTCAPLHQVAAVLSADGLDVEVDEQCRYSSWHGGRDGLKVLVTAHKLAGAIIVDDRAVSHAYGKPWEATFAEIECTRVMLGELDEIGDEADECGEEAAS